jgi:antitoxin HicB
MHSFNYPVTLTPNGKYAEDETGFVETFSDFPETITQGNDEADALDQAADAIEETIAGRMKHGEDIPLATYQTGPLVPVPMQTALKAALYLTLPGERERRSALRDRIRKDGKEVRHFLDPHPCSAPNPSSVLCVPLGRG